MPPVVCGKPPVNISTTSLESNEVSAVPAEVLIAKTSVEESPVAVYASVTRERPASAANHREHLDVLESTEVSAISADVFHVKTSRRLGSRQASKDCFLFTVVLCELVPSSG